MKSMVLRLIMNILGRVFPKGTSFDDLTDEIVKSLQITSTPYLENL